MSYFNYTEVNDKSAFMDDSKRINKEKMNGNFKVHILKTIPWKEKIYQLANDNIAFYLHKKRFFFSRIEGKIPKEEE